MARVKEEVWPLNSGDSTAIPSTGRADGTANRWNDIWKYRVPNGQAHILKAENTFSAYLYEESVAECGGGTCRVQIVVKDQSEQDSKIVYGPVLYAIVKEFSDKAKMAKLGLVSDIAVEEEFYIILQAYDDGIVDESVSYFSLETIRVRSTV